MNSNNRKISAAVPFFLGEPSALIPTFCVSPCPSSPLLTLSTSFLLPSSPPPLILTSHLPLTPHSTSCVSPHPWASFPVWILTLSFPLAPYSSSLLPVWALSPHPHFLSEPSALIPTSCLSPQPSFPLPAWVLLSHPHHLCKPSPLIHTCLPLYPLSPLASCSHWLVNEKWILTDLCECMSWGSGKDKARCHILFLPKHWLIQISDHEAEWVSHSMVAQSDAVDLYLIDREISLDIIIFFFQVVSKNPSMQKKKSILNDMLFITRASFTKVLWFISACNL